MNLNNLNANRKTNHGRYKSELGGGPSGSIASRVSNISDGLAAVTVKQPISNAFRGNRKKPITVMQGS